MIAISDSTDVLKGDFARIRHILTSVLRCEGACGDYSIAYVNDRKMAELHRAYLGRRGPTDVLAFPLAEGTAAAGDRWVGEVVVSVETASRVARRLGIDPDEELVRYSIHGLLHLLGYEDKRAASRRVLKAREEYYLQVLYRS